MSLETTADQYRVPASRSDAEIKVKGSRFIAAIEPVSDRQQAEDLIGQYRKRYYDATHNCFAYRIGEDDFRYSDDGEPSGTAGKPIFQVLEGADLQQAICVVTRYFGGTKLGTGGLARAYSDAAHQALDKLKIKTLLHTSPINLIFTYEFENLVRNLINEFHASLIDSQYSDRVEMRLAVPRSLCARFRKDLEQRSNTKVQIIQD